eukprot:CAMPEP_0172576056 /NCGR_PEP_ID=MMETSP1067-20121228/137528_1 /TAXON_ID=265564 ORGANISM="Thalassiosira punctigera, Strain Tpunct2005C2" /NCGR_SAMPLE_ID=MMETSP1067 /ASSEMBLY_ACC=CAM_ASM_000444 /LENGTH=196 /DNA_ID=CAMNT_0013368717 /DNA_START=9 /DNA_END=599 /DNA_ORIENTATION=-
MNAGSIDHNMIRVDTNDDAKQVESESKVRPGSRLGDINGANTEEKDEVPKEESEERAQLSGNWLGDTNEAKSGGTREVSKDEIEKETQPKEWGQTIRVPMKTGDGGSALAADADGSDAFSRYSNRNVRMMHLLNLDDDDEGEANEENTDWRRITGYQGLEEGEAEQNGKAGGRKTCLSTELDPHIFLGMIFGDGDD